MHYERLTRGLFSALLLTSVPAGAEEIGGVEFPQGAASFADRVVGYDLHDATGVAAPYDDPELALGIPDYDGNTSTAAYVSLGNAPSSGTSSELTLEFVDNRLVDIEGDDLYVFEIGPAVEATSLAVSIDGSEWFQLGRIDGSTRGVDLADFPELPVDALYRYVRLSDYPDGSASGSPYGGPDIDAVGAIGADVSDEDDDGVHDDGDNCVTAANPDQANQDTDPLGDVCDVCPEDANDTEDGCPPSNGEGGAGGRPAGGGEGGEPSAAAGTPSGGGAAGEPAGADAGESGGGGEPAIAPPAGGQGGDDTASAGTQATAGTGGSGTAGTTGSAGTGTATNTDEDSGCGCRIAEKSDESPLGFAAFLALVFARRLRRRGTGERTAR